MDKALIRTPFVRYSKIAVVKDGNTSVHLVLTGSTDGVPFRIETTPAPRGSVKTEFEKAHADLNARGIAHAQEKLAKGKNTP